jgi:hypothetical protein
MIAESLTSLLVSGAASAGVIWLTKTWISEHLRQSITYEYAARLESVGENRWNSKPGREVR